MNCHILKAFMPIINNFKRQFGAFSAAREVTHQLQEIKWKAGNIINFIQAIQNALKKVTATHLTSDISSYSSTDNSAKFKMYFLTS